MEKITFNYVDADEKLDCLDWLVSLLKSHTKKKTSIHFNFCHTVSDIVFVLSWLPMKLGNYTYINGQEAAPERCLLGVYYSATPAASKLRINSFYCLLPLS